MANSENELANNIAEFALSSAKHLMQKNKDTYFDPFLGLRDFQEMYEMESSLNQRLLNGHTCSLLPMSINQLKPRLMSPGRDDKILLKRRHKVQVAYYNCHARDLFELDDGNVVRMRSHKKGDHAWEKVVINHRLSKQSGCIDVTSVTGAGHRSNPRKSCLPITLTDTLVSTRCYSRASHCRE